jgi:hypothetical protein
MAGGPHVPGGRRQRSLLGVLLALLLLEGGALLSVIPESCQRAAAMRAVRFPRRMEEKDWNRAASRHMSWPRPNPGQPPSPPRAPPRDPLHVALPGTMKRSAFVIEVSAVLASPLGEPLLACLSAQTPELFAGLARAGVDPRRQIDRIAIVDDLMVATGDFKGSKVDQFVPGATTEPYGLYGKLLEREDGEGDITGVWKDEVVVTGHSLEEVTQALDRLESKGEPSAQLLLPQDAYGDVYGQMNPAMAGQLIGQSESGLVTRLQEVASRASVHIDLADDLALVMDLEGSQPDQVSGLGKAYVAALALARVQAAARGDTALATILGQGRAVPGMPGQTRMELALPSATIQAQLKQCAARTKAASLPVASSAEASKPEQR